MSRLEPADVPDLPIAFMNADHLLEAELVNAVEDALLAHGRGIEEVDLVMERLSLLAVHTREHFLREESMMREAGFPAYPVHKGEHDRVLAEMNTEARVFRSSGDGARLARYLEVTLPSWFRNHLRTMDVATARFVAGARSGAYAE